MNAFWGIVASNAVVATILAIAAILLGRVLKNAAAAHLLWVVVLLKLFTPPLVTADLPSALAPSPASADPGERVSRSSALGRVESIVPAAATALRRAVEAGGRGRTPRAGAAAVAGREPWSSSAILAAIWALGALGLAGVQAVRIRRFAAGLREFEPAPEAIRAKVAELSRRLGLRRVPEVLMTPRALPPLVWSLGSRPRVILPSRLFARLDGEARGTILAHELIHIRRGDHLVRLLELAASTVFWWHPVVHLASRQLRRLEEECCDAGVLELLPGRPRTYAAALVDTLEFLSGRTNFAPLRTAIHPAGPLSRRIRMLTLIRPSRLSARGASLLVGLAGFPLAFAFAAALEPAKAVPPARASADAPSAVLRGRVTNKAGVALPGARVRVSVAAANMLQVDAGTAATLLEATTDQDGDYRLEIPGIAKRTTISVDAMMPGFRKLWGTPMAGGDAKRVEVEPGATVEAKLALDPSRYFRGVVVDEQGHPVPGAEITATFVFDRGMGYIEFTASGPDGAFELFNYPAEPRDFRGIAGKGVVSFSHPDYIRSRIEDVDAIEPDRRREIRVVLAKGRKVAGTVLDAAGKPVAGAMVEAALAKGVIDRLGDGTNRKATLTDAAGKFSLSGLVGGETILDAVALAIKQKVRLPMDLGADKEGLEVQLQPMDLPADLKKYDVLGMRLADATPALKSAYDLFFDQGALILDPGPDFARLQIGDLVEGNLFFLVGERRVGSVREFVDAIIAETVGREAEVYSVRVVYSFKATEFVGNNTQYLKITKGDLKDLKALSDRLKADAR